MEIVTRILIVEDSPADAELNIHEALKVLDSCEFETVETEPDFLEKLNSFKPDLILSDYSMPVFDGLTALSLALKHAADIPVIIVTGSVNEDTAVECMQAGASNYVIKQHIKRLGPAIIHALSEGKKNLEHKKAQEALMESELRYRSLFNLSPIGIFVQDENNIIIDVNENYCIISGYNKDELIGNHISLIVPENDVNNITTNTRRIFKGEQLRLEVESRKKDGTAISLELTESMVTLPNGTKGIMTISNDITERKNAEGIIKRQAEFQQRLMDAIPIPVFYKDKNGIYQDCNKAFETFLGQERKNIKGKSVFDIHKQKLAEIYFNADNELINSGGIQEYESLVKGADGKLHDIIFRKATYAGPDGEIAGLIGSMNDISERKVIERSLSQKNRHLQLLSQYAIKLTDMPEDGDVATLLVDKVKIITGAVFAAFSEFDPGDKTLITKHVSADQKILNALVKLAGKKILNVKSPVSEENYRHMLSNDSSSFNSITEMTFGAVPQFIDNNIKRLSGITRYFGISFNLGDELFGTLSFGLKKDQPDPDIEVLSSIARLTSLTLRRKRAEEELKEREERLRKIVNSSQDAMIIMDDTGNINLWNHSAEILFGYQSKDVIGKNLQKLIIPEQFHENFSHDIKAFINAEKDPATGKMLEMEFLRKNGEKFPAETAFSAIKINNSWFSVFSVRDITERKKAEINFIRSETRYHELFDAYKDGIAVISIEPTNEVSSFLELNNAAAAMLGYSRQEMMQIPLYALEVGYNEHIMIQRRTELEQKSSSNFETQFIHKSGRLVPVEVSVSIINYTGRPALLNIVKDISDRTFREKLQKMQYNIANSVINANSLSELYEAVRIELASLIDTRNFFIAFLNQDSGMLNAPFEKEEKDSVNEWPADKSLTGLVISRQKPILLNRDQISGMAKSGEITIIGTRSEKWLGVPLFNGKKAIGAMVVQSYDNPDAYNQDSVYILELAAHELSSYIGRKEAEQNALKLSKAIEQNPVSIVITDKNGKIEYTNPKFSQVTGYSRIEALSNNPNILKSGYHTEAFYKNLWDTITSGNDWSGEIKNKKKDGTFYWENAIISPILNETGTITHFVAVKEDISEKKVFLEELKIAKEKAEESDRLKTAFLQNISHEIRTPLNGILGFSELLVQDWATPEEKTEYNEAIQISGKRLIEIVSNVLDISIIETGQVILNPEKFKLNSLFQNLYNFFHSQALQKGLQLKYELGCDGDHCLITADQSRINQVMTNLLNNAIKYTKRGGIIFSYKIVKNEVIFNVCDTGIGIDISHHQRIFTRFYQAEHSSARSYEGAGLGLSISHGLVSAMGGKIWFESEAGNGSSFSFSIPISEIIEQQEVIIPAEIVVSETDIILIADDDNTSYMLLATTLKKRNIKIMHAITGIEAVDMVKQYDNIRLILMDVKMPEMDGLEATRIIKMLKPDLPIIMQTAYAFSDDIAEAYAAGCSDYLSKPIATEKLNHIYDKYLGAE